MPESPRLTRPHYLLAGLAGYLLAIVPMALLVAFLANVPIQTLSRTIDRGVLVPPAEAFAVDLALLLSFGVVHSLLARDRIKRAVTRLVPEALERSVYSLIAGLQIVLLLAAWRPIPAAVWTIEAPVARAAIWALYLACWAIVLATLESIGSTHLFGFARARAAARGEAYREPPIAARGTYRFVRHPLYGATIVALFATPDMSAGHLLLAGVFTAYTFVGLWFEERDLERRHGASWLEYKASVPSLVPRLLPRRRI